MPDNQKDQKLPTLEELGDKITTTRKKHEPKPLKERQLSATHLVVEMVSGVLVGSFLGIGLDYWLDTAPLFFLICLFFGVAGSALNIYKLAPKQHSKEDVDERNND